MMYLIRRFIRMLVLGGSALLMVSCSSTSSQNSEAKNSDKLNGSWYGFDTSLSTYDSFYYEYHFKSDSTVYITNEAIILDGEYSYNVSGSKLFMYEKGSSKSKGEKFKIVKINNDSLVVYDLEDKRNFYLFKIPYKTNIFDKNNSNKNLADSFHKRMLRYKYGD